MYLPKSKYKVRTSLPGEFLTNEGQEYIGPVVQTFTGACYPGTDPKTMGSQLTPVVGKEPVELGFYNIKRVPTEAEYKAGKMLRYFVQERKTQKIIEINLEIWQKNYRPDDILRSWASIDWYLTGSQATVRVLNQTTIDYMERAMPGIVSSRVLYNPLQFYKAKA